MTIARVLLVEQRSTQPVGLMLRKAGYVVDAVTAIDVVVGILIRFQPDVAISCGDGRGTFTPGWQAAQRLRAAHSQLPLVMMTTNSMALREVGSTQRGQWFVEGVRKPFSLLSFLGPSPGFAHNTSHISLLAISS